MKLSPKLAQAFVNLRTSGDFAVVLEGLQEHRAEEANRCVEGDGPVLYRAQGATKSIQWWLDNFRDAPAALEKFKQGKNTP